MEDCIFCKIVRGEIPADKVFESETILAFLDINPVNQGHTLIVPKNHFDRLEDTPDEVAGEMIKAAKIIGSVLQKAIGSDGFNLGLNNGDVAGQIVKHVHLHVMPRFKNDGLQLWPARESTSENRQATARKIRFNLDN